MNIYENHPIGNLVKADPYVGRGIVVGKTNNNKAAVAYFIMGRSENSRNRVFIEKGDDVVIHPFDASKVSDPSLIIYSPVKKIGQRLVVTNGDQTDTICDFLQKGASFEDALDTRMFEPDAPNYTPRISSMLAFKETDFAYKMNILKSTDELGSACARYTFSYPAVAGLGHFIHTYAGDGNPLPTFQGEPERVAMADDIDVFTKEIWDNLNESNKISLYVRFIDLETGAVESRMINKNQ